MPARWRIYFCSMCVTSNSKDTHSCERRRQCPLIAHLSTKIAHLLEMKLAIFPIETRMGVENLHQRRVSLGELDEQKRLDCGNVSVKATNANVIIFLCLFRFLCMPNVRYAIHLEVHNSRNPRFTTFP